VRLVRDSGASFARPVEFRSYHLAGQAAIKMRAYFWLRTAEAANVASLALHRRAEPLSHVAMFARRPQHLTGDDNNR